MKRNKREEFEYKKFLGTFDQWNNQNEISINCINGKDKVIVSPIIYWTNADVWNFIRERKLKYCELYDKGYHRIGCVFCPMKSVKSKQLDRKNYPGIEKAIKKSIDELIKNGSYGEYNDSNDVFDWWISNDTKDKYISSKLQLKLYN